MKSDATVFVVDDDPAMRRSLRWLIESVGLHVQVFDSPQQFLEGYQPSKPGCLVLDVRMPEISGLELQEKLTDQRMLLPVIIITGYGDVPSAVRAMKAGAIDFIEKPFSDQHLLDCIQRAIDLDAQRRRDESVRDQVAGRAALMTPRERQVMDLVVRGTANKQIAVELGLSEKTVEVHRSRVMAKMQATSVADLVRMAMIIHPESAMVAAR